MMQRKFNMPKLRRRAKKELKKRFGKEIKPSDVDRIWKQYVEYGITEPLARYGKVVIDKNFSIEVVGQKITDNPRVYAIFKRGIGIRRNGTVNNNGANLHPNRDGYFYKIVGTDKNFSGGALYFIADKKIRARISKELKETKTYYRII